MQTRTLLIGYGCLTLLALGVYQFYRFRGTKALRTPMGKPAQVEAATEHDPCHQIYRVACQKEKAETRDPTGTVHPDITGEMQTLRIYEEIIHRHPDWSTEQVDAGLVQKIYTPKRRAQLFEVFDWVQKALEIFIIKQPASVFSEQEKALLLERIKKVRLELPPPASLYADEPALFTKNDVYFERLNGDSFRLRVGGAYLFSVKSWFNRVFTFAHEMAHAIDPCELRVSKMSIRAFDRLAACFEDQKLFRSSFFGKGCGEEDQLEEAFADWVAVQITAMALKEHEKTYSPTQMTQAIANSVRDLCEQDDAIRESDTSRHLPPDVRIEQLFGHHPVIRELLGCDKDTLRQTEPAAYCSF